MNASELKKLLLKAAKMPLEQLSGSDIQKLSKTLQTTVRSLEKVTILSKIEELHHTVAIEDMNFFKYYLDQLTVKKPTVSSSIQSWQEYLVTLQHQYKEIEKKKRSYIKVLERIDRSSEKKALEIIDKLSMEDRKMVSSLANLTLKTNKGVSKVKLTNSKNTNIAWYRELKNTKHLGVLSNE
ncbi:MAG: hypothetical protein AAF518_23845 [Spirochaetota bacterium]